MSRDVDRGTQINRLRVIQDWRCGACGADASRRNLTLHLDHDHITGMTRGLLCIACNVAEGTGAGGRRVDAYLANPPAGPLGWEFQDHAGYWALDTAGPPATHEGQRAAAAALASILFPTKETP